MQQQALNRSAIRIATLALVAVLFLAVNLFSNVVFRSAQIDLTQARLFTLSQGTENVLAKIDEPVTLKFFYSESLATDFPQIRAYANRVRDLLQEIRDRAHGRIVLEVIDPEPFSEQEDLAMSLGLKGARTTEGEVIYFGLVGANLVDGIEAIPFFTDERQQYLEYDVTRLIQNLSRPKKPVLGIVTNIPMDTGAGGLVAAMRGQSQPFAIYQELQNRFEINFLEQKFARVPANVDVLMIAHPKPLDEETLYAIDQFAMRGGRVLAFVDPHSEVSLTAGPDGRPVQGYTESSDLAPLLKSWGVDFDAKHVVGDRDLAIRVQTGLDARRQTSDYVLWMSVPKGNFDPDDIVTASIDHINIGTVGSFRPAPGATTKFTPLFWSSGDAETYDLDYVKSGPTPDELLSGFKPTGERYVFAARLSGPLKSAFPAAPVPPAGEDPTKGSDAADRPEAFLDRTKVDANIIIVADSDIFDDRFWVQAGGYGSDRGLEPIADNAKFVLSAIDNLMGSDDLISLRARERADRPFVVVDNLRREAERQFLAEQQRLQARISETEQRLAALQTEGAAESHMQGGEASDPHAQEEIAQFRAELLQSRKALRDVQRNLRRDIDRLATEIRFANVMLMPILVAVAALGIAVLRHRRRKARAARGGQVS